MNKKGLDEMQIQKRNKIGNQAFLMLLYLLMLDGGLYGFGFRWVSYPANIIIIVMICAGIYLVRLITGNAYVGPSSDKKKPIFKIFLTTIVSVFIALIILVLLKNVSFSNESQIDDMAAPILFITASVTIIIATVIAIIKNLQNKNDQGS